MTELRQAVISWWFLRHRNAAESDTRTARTEADKRGAAAAHARFTVQLLSDEAEVLRRATAAFEPITAIENAADLKALRMHEDRSEEALSEFIHAAGRDVR